MNIELFIEGTRIELYPDENLIYKGKVIDSQNIEAIFNDVVNTFSVPSNTITDRVFKYWFQISIINGFQPNKRLNAYLQFDSVPLKFGKVELEEIVEKDGRIDSYKVTFYGNLTGLSDIFGEDKIGDLPLSKFNFPLIKNNFQAGLTFPALMTLDNGLNEKSDVVFPFIISRDAPVEFRTGVPSDIRDISQFEGRLSVKNFRPGIRQIRLIEGIEEKYNIKFSRDFFNTASFKNSYMWCNRNEEYDNIIDSKKIDISNAGTFTREVPDVSIGTEPDVVINDDGTITVERDSKPFFNQLTFGETYKYQYFMRFITKNVSNPNVDYEIRVVNDDTGEVINRNVNLIGAINRTYNDRFGFINYASGSSNRTKYRIEVLANDTLTFDLDLEISTNIQSDTAILIDATLYNVNNVTYTINTNFSIADNLPDLSIKDYLTNIIKQYKLIIRPVNDSEFYIDNITEYFRSGNTLDLTEYVNVKESSPTKKYKTYKDIEFKFREPDTVVQNSFKDFYGRYRGNSKKVYDVDNKETLTLNIGFEVPYFVRLKDGGGDEPSFINLALLQEIDEGGAENGDDTTKAVWTENPVIFYYNGITRVMSGTTQTPIIIDYLTEGSTSEPTADLITTEFITLCDVSDNEVLTQVNNTFDYASTTVNGWHTQSIENNLYTNYYEPWIDLTYSDNSRIKEFTCKDVPFRFINELELNTSIIINNDKYNIEEFELNLLNNDIKFKLFPSNFNPFGLSSLSNETVNISVNAGGNYDSIEVESNKAIEVLPVNSTWLKVEPITFSKGIHKVSFYVAYNPTNSLRTESFFIKSDGITKEVVITQRTYLD